MSRELAAFKVSRDIVNSQGKNIDGKVWSREREEIRGRQGLTQFPLRSTQESKRAQLSPDSFEVRFAT